MSMGATAVHEEQPTPTCFPPGQIVNRAAVYFDSFIGIGH